MSSSEEDEKKLPNKSVRFETEIYSVKKKPPKSTSRRLPQAQAPPMAPPPPPQPQTTQETPNDDMMPDMPELPQMPFLAAPQSSSGGGGGGGGGGSNDPIEDDPNDPITPVAKAPRTIATHPGAKHSFLDHRVMADDDELHDDNERALTHLLKLHPMLCLDVTSQRVLDGAAKLVGDYAIPTVELEAVDKTHDDMFFRPARAGSGERPCVNGDKCIAQWLATFRYGENSIYHFTCREFLLPSQLKKFNESGCLPKQSGKCLLCTRYWHSYVFTLARTSPSFCPKSCIQVQAFGNAIGVSEAGEIPSLSNAVDDECGYKSDVMLYVDERWSETNVARSHLGTMLWRPVVRFNSSDYVFVKPEHKNQQPQILQIGMSKKDSTNSQLFRAPPSSKATRVEVA
jgi:hypothetical protein